MVGYKTSNSNIGDIPWNQFAGLALCEWCSGHGRVGTWASVRCCLGQHVPQPGQLVWQLLDSVEYCLQPARHHLVDPGQVTKANVTSRWPAAGRRSRAPQATCFKAVGESD